MEVRIIAEIRNADIEWPIYSKVVGVTKKYDDGERRQDILAGCEVGR